MQNAKTNLDRYQRLAKQDAIALQIVDNAATAYATAQAQVAQAQASVAAARTDLDYSLIKAPFSGRIGISQVRLGSQVSPGTTLLNTISGEDPVGVDFVVTEADLGRFAELQRSAGSNPDSLFRLELSDGTMYPQPGRILAIDRGVDQQTGTVQIRVQFPNPQRELKDGMSTVLHVLNRQSGQRVVIPFKAVTEQMGENFVFVAGDSSKAEQRKVQLGPRLRDQIVIIERHQSRRPGHHRRHPAPARRRRHPGRHPGRRRSSGQPLTPAPAPPLLGEGCVLVLPLSFFLIDFPKKLPAQSSQTQPVFTDEQPSYQSSGSPSRPRSSGPGGEVHRYDCRNLYPASRYGHCHLAGDCAGGGAGHPEPARGAVPGNYAAHRVGVAVFIPGPMPRPWSRPWPRPWKCR